MIIMNTTSHQHVARVRRSHRDTYHSNPITVPRTSTRIGTSPHATHPRLIPNHPAMSDAVRMARGGDAVHIGLRPLGGERCRCRGSRAHEPCALVITCKHWITSPWGLEGARVPREQFPVGWDGVAFL